MHQNVAVYANCRVCALSKYTVVQWLIIVIS